MKKIFSLLLILIFITACTIKNEKSNLTNTTTNIQQEQTTEQTEKQKEFFSNSNIEENDNKENEKKEIKKTIISCQDCFHNIGFVEKQCEESGTYYFERVKNEDDEYNIFDWYVYVFDETQNYKEIKDYKEPVLTNEGNIELKKGQYIYILCSYNPDTEVLPSNSDQSYIYYIK